MGCPISKGLAREKGGVIEKGRKLRRVHRTLELVPPMTRTGAREEKKRGASAPYLSNGASQAWGGGTEAGRRGSAGTLVVEDSAQRGGLVQVPQCPALVQNPMELGWPAKSRA